MVSGIQYGIKKRFCSNPSDKEAVTIQSHCDGHRHHTGPDYINDRLALHLGYIPGDTVLVIFPAVFPLIFFSCLGLRLSCGTSGGLCRIRRLLGRQLKKIKYAKEKEEEDKLVLHSNHLRNP